MPGTAATYALTLPKRVLIPVSVIVLGLPALVVAAAIYQPWLDPKWLFLDVVVAAREADECCHIAFGFMSQLGIIMWACVAATGLLTALVLWIRGDRSAAFSLTLFAGLLHGWMALDDALLLHESVLPGLGLRQTYILVFYILLGAGYLLSGWRLLLRSDWWLLAIGLAAVGSSLLLDLTVYDRSTAGVVLEDGLKFYGLAVWSAYHIALFTLIQLRAPHAGS